jgi:hypothetical protein
MPDGGRSGLRGLVCLGHCSRSDTGSPQTRQLCARKAGLNDTHSFVDLWIGPTTRWYSSIAKPNTHVRTKRRHGRWGTQVRRDATGFPIATTETGRRRAWTGCHFFHHALDASNCAIHQPWRKLYKQATTCFHVRFRYRERPEHSSGARGR